MNDDGGGGSLLAQLPVWLYVLIGAATLGAVMGAESSPHRELVRARGGSTVAELFKPKTSIVKIRRRRNLVTPGRRVTTSGRRRLPGKE